MSTIDETMNDEKPRVYQSEGGGDRSADIVNDDKADLSRIAQDEVEDGSLHAARIRPNQTSTSSCSKRSALSNNEPNLSNYRSSNRVAFNPANYSPLDVIRFAAAHHMLQRCYDGFFLSGNCVPTGNTVNALQASAAFIPSLYGTPLPVGVCSPTWWPFSSQLDAAAKTTGIFWPVSPNFAYFDNTQFNMALNSAVRQVVPSPTFQPSPLHSPDTGATIAPLASKMPSAASAIPSTSLITTMSAAVSAQNGLLVPKSNVSTSSSKIRPTSVTMYLADRHSSTINAPACLTSKRRPVEIPSATNASNSAFSAAMKFSRLNDKNRSQVTSALKLSSVVKDSMRKSHHIKKPLNAFMLFMKEMRPKVMDEAGLKERQSAEINRILGKRWHDLSRADQQKFYDLARQARQEHLQKYPDWSARDNYALHKRRKKKREKTIEGVASDNLEAKKCRARFGLDQQTKWCKHCRRKKKCLWFKESDAEVSDAGGNGTMATGGTAKPLPRSTSEFAREQMNPCTSGKERKRIGFEGPTIISDDDDDSVLSSEDEGDVSADEMDQ